MARRNEQQPIERQHIQRRMGRSDMAMMHRIESATEKSQSHYHSACL
jgi:hypothetical protein